MHGTILLIGALIGMGITSMFYMLGADSHKEHKEIMCELMRIENYIEEIKKKDNKVRKNKKG